MMRTAKLNGRRPAPLGHKWHSKQTPDASVNIVASYMQPQSMCGADRTTSPNANRSAVRARGGPVIGRWQRQPSLHIIRGAKGANATPNSSALSHMGGGMQPTLAELADSPIARAKQPLVSEWYRRLGCAPYYG